MSVLVTGAAGFIGYHVSAALLDRGEAVIGVDNMNDYYSVALKQARLARLQQRNNFQFRKLDIADHDALFDLAKDQGIDRIVHLAAQAGVRYSLSNPFAYVRANVDGHTAVLELARKHGRIKHLVFASSSSVYGGNTKLPFAVEDRVDHPVSLYAATKKSGELISHAYAHLYQIPQTGLRFFTVYGPWGRPDMALYLFSDAILAGRPIQVFNHGDMRRDFTYIDDIVAGVLAVLDRPPVAGAGAPPIKLYNIGNNRPEPLLRLIEVLEASLGVKAQRELLPMQAGDVKETYADIGPIARDCGFAPKTPIDVGVPRFVQWYRDYRHVAGGGA